VSPSYLSWRISEAPSIIFNVVGTCTGTRELCSLKSILLCIYQGWEIVIQLPDMEIYATIDSSLDRHLSAEVYQAGNEAIDSSLKHLSVICLGVPFSCSGNFTDAPHLNFAGTN
jgi:hypothetical protein